MMKTCKQCGAEKPLDEFYKNGEDRSRSACKVCHREKTNAYRRAQKERDPEHARQRDRRRALRELHGMTPEQYEEMLVAQGGRCAVCGSESSKSKNQRHLHIDHCHRTGQVWGLLCGQCNRAAGALEDDPNRVLALAAYEPVLMSVS